MDSLAFGAPRFLRHLMDPTTKRIPVVEFELSKVLEELNLTMDQFIDVCILSGCDYCESIKGIGGVTALKLVRQHGSLEHILENINKERYQIPFDWPYQETQKLFREPSVLTDSDQLELKWTDPDEDGLVSFLVNENNFNIDRIIKATKKIKTAMDKFPRLWSESYSKPVGATVSAKAKVARCSLAVSQRKIEPLRGPCDPRPKAVAGSSSMQTYRSLCLGPSSSRSSLALIN